MYANQLIGKGDDEGVMGAEGVMRWLGDLGVDLENITALIPQEIVQAPSLAEVTKDGFVKGWLEVK